MCISTIIEELCSVEWDIVPTEGMEEQAVESEMAHIKSFFMNPNTNNESFEDVFIKMPMRDLLEVNTGLLNKVYNLKQDMVEIVARDAATFTKSPDIHGMFTDRVDVLTPKHIVNNIGEVINDFQQIPTQLVTELAAYYQYGWIAGPVPVPFGKREIVWMQGMQRTDDHYGYSAVMLLNKSLQTLIYYIESDLDYFNNNNIPKGIIGLDGGDADDLEAFKTQWNDIQTTKDEFGNYKKIMHRIPILTYSPKFERIEFTSNEMQIIEKQKWWTKMVWASFGVTATELGYSEDAQGMANQIVQSKVFRKKAINPKLRMMENRYNADIVSEFGYVGYSKDSKIEVPKYKFKFMVFDVDEERNKYELFELQTKSAIKTINEIRTQEGLDEVEWGDKPPREWQQADNNNFFGDNPFNPGNSRNADNDGQQSQDYDDKQKNAQNTKKNANKEPDIDKKKSKKSRSVESDYNKALLQFLKDNENNIKDLISKEVKPDIIKQIKSEKKALDDLIKQLAGILTVDVLKKVTEDFVRTQFLEGWDQAEKEIDRNFIPDESAIKFISDYTFDNVKGMTDDIANKLKGELSRGLMEGEGINELKARVSKVFDVGEVRAEMISRTEATRSQNAGRFIAYKTSGEKGKRKYDAHIDNRTSPLCRRLDGQIVDFDKPFKDPNGEWEGFYPPAHVNCRSSWVFIPDED